MKFKLFLLLAALLMNPLNAAEESELRINRLLPDIVYIPGIEPAIPNDFVASKMNENSVIFWGPKDVIEAYQKDPKSLKQPLIAVYIDYFTQQTESDTFNIENEDLPNKSKFKWEGEDLSYPVLRYEIPSPENAGVLYIASMGLNSPCGETLTFRLIYPNDSEKPTTEVLNFWNHFLKNTKVLSTYDFLRAQGHEMHIGNTLYTLAEAQLKFSAEQRKSDKQLRIVVIPVKGKVEYELDDILVGTMGFKWHQDAPLVKLAGNVNATNTKYGDIFTNDIINILIKEVETFSISDQEIKNHPEYVTRDLKAEEFEE